MSVATELCDVSLPWTGVETSFAPGFPARDRSHVKAEHITAAGVVTPLILDVHYGVTLASETRIATVTPIALPPAPADIRIYRRTPATHSNQFLDSVRYPQSVHEDVADRAAMRAAENRKMIADALAILTGFLADVAAAKLARDQAVEARDEAVEIFDNFDDRYLRDKTALPSLDNDGDPLQEGALCFLKDQVDPDDNGLYRWNGVTWLPIGFNPSALPREDYAVVAVDGATSIPVTGGYVPGQIRVYLNGKKIRLGASPVVGDPAAPGATASDGLNIVFPANLLLAGDLVEWVITKPFQAGVSDAVDVSVVQTGGIAEPNIQAALQALHTLLGQKAPLASAPLTGAPTCPTPATPTGIANKDYVDTALSALGVEFREFTLSATHSSPVTNALTIALKDAAGADATPGAPITFAFRDPTASSGALIKRQLTGALSLVVSAGSTLGTANATPCRVWIVLFDDGGTLRLGAVQCRLTTGVLPLRPQNLADATSEGGAGAADGAGTIYANAAISAKPYIVLGCLDWDTGLVTAGNWNAAPSRISGWFPGRPLPGERIQPLLTNGSGSSSSSTSFAIPTGASLPITPSRPQNAVLASADADGFVAAAGAGNPTLVAALFRSTTQIGGSRSLGLTSGGGGVNLNVSGALALAALDWPAVATAVTYSYQHRVTATGSVTSSNIALRLEEICG
jgi:hypothetical protein